MHNTVYAIILINKDTLCFHKALADDKPLLVQRENKDTSIFVEMQVCLLKNNFKNTLLIACVRYIKVLFLKNHLLSQVDVREELRKAGENREQGELCEIKRLHKLFPALSPILEPGIF